MTDKELRKLKRADLLEILYYMQKEIADLTKENEALRNQMDNMKATFSENEMKRIIKAVKSAAREGIMEAAQSEAPNDTNNQTDEHTNKEGNGKHGKGKRDKT